MKNKLFLILISALSFCSCTNKIQEEINNQVATENKTAYIDGFNVHNTYVIKKCYVRFTLEGSGLNVQTSYSSNLITEDMLPYYYVLKTPIKIGKFKDYSYFQFGMYVAANTSADGVQLIDATLKAADMDGKRKYTVTDPDNGTMVDIIISYK